MTRNNFSQINNLVQKFLNKDLPKDKWTHNTHLIVGIWHCQQYGFYKALPLLKIAIRDYNEAIGTHNTDSSGYHETLTIFWMIVIRNYLHLHPDISPSQQYSNFLNSDQVKSSYPLEYYTHEKLFGTNARQRWANGDVKKIAFHKGAKCSDHHDLDDECFVQRLSDCSLPPALFTHDAHLRLAWILIHRYGLPKAEKEICRLIINFVSHLNATDKFHTTLTVIATRIVNRFIRLSYTQSFIDLILQNPQLISNFKDLVMEYYSFDIFSNESAKYKFLEPDIQKM